MIDSDTGFVLWTAIWKSLGNNKGQPGSVTWDHLGQIARVADTCLSSSWGHAADIVKLVESYEGLEDKIIKIRGGFLKVSRPRTASKARRSHPLLMRVLILALRRFKGPGLRTRCAGETALCHCAGGALTFWLASLSFRSPSYLLNVSRTTSDTP